MRSSTLFAFQSRSTPQPPPPPPPSPSPPTRQKDRGSSLLKTKNVGSRQRWNIRDQWAFACAFLLIIATIFIQQRRILRVAIVEQEYHQSHQQLQHHHHEAYPDSSAIPYHIDGGTGTNHERTAANGKQPTNQQQSRGQTSRRNQQGSDLFQWTPGGPNHKGHRFGWATPLDPDPKGWQSRVKVDDKRREHEMDVRNPNHGQELGGISSSQGTVDAKET